MNIEQSDLSALKNSVIINSKIKDKKMQITKSDKVIYHTIKRIIDIILSLVALVVLLPVFLIIAIAIKIDSKGTVFFKHKRIGKNGKDIYIYKFRTMKPNAEDMIKDFTEEQMKEFKESYKLKDDPRITRIGKFLRKTSLD